MKFEFPAHYLARVLNYLRRVVARSTAEAVASFRNNNVKTKFLSICVYKNFIHFDRYGNKLIPILFLFFTGQLKLSDPSSTL